jgi:hypothetical protein
VPIIIKRKGLITSAINLDIVTIKGRYYITVEAREYETELKIVK